MIGIENYLDPFIYAPIKKKASGAYKTVNGNPISISDGFPVNAKGLSVALEPIQDLHGYDNPWPAGGGKNIWDEETVLGILNADGSVSFSSNRLVTKNYIPITPGETYSVVVPYNSRGRGAFYGSDYSLIGYYGDFPQAATPDVFPNGSSLIPSGDAYYFTFIAPAGAYYVKYNIVTAYGDTYKNDIAFNYPSTVTTYAPYSNICPISGHSEVSVVRTDGDGQQSLSLTIPLGDTVYGGTVDAVNGVLTVDRAMVVVENCSEVSIASTRIPYARTNIAVSVKAESTRNRNISSEYRYRVNAPSDSGWFRVIGPSMFIFDSRFTDLSTANSILSSEKPQFVVELATPITVTLTPQDLMMLLGDNVITSDGTITLDYYCDFAKYIAKKIAEVQALILS